MVELLQRDRHIAVNVIPMDGPGILVNPQAHSAGPGNELRVQFTVNKSLTHEPNTAEIRIYNLGQIERRRADGVIKSVDDDVGIGAVIDAREPSTAFVQVFAGYAGAVAEVFRGGGASVEHRHDRVDWVTTIRAGEHAWALSQATANRTFAPGTPALSVLQYLCKVLGVALAPGAIPSGLASYTLQGPLVCFGRARDALDSLLASLPLEWWVDDGVLVLLELPGIQAELGLAPSVSTLPLPVVIVSVEPIAGAAALLEQPQRTEGGGARIRMRLWPTLRPGQRMTIAGGQSELSGSYRVERITHTGDNRGGQFVTEVELRGLGV